MEELGGEDAYAQYLEELGVDEETFTRLQSASLLIGDMTDLTLQEGSELYLPEEGYDQYATYADHILLATQDTATGAALSEEEIAEKRQTAEDLLSQLQASDDVVTLFGQLATSTARTPAGRRTPTGTSILPAPWSPSLRTRRRPGARPGQRHRGERLRLPHHPAPGPERGAGQ